MDIVEYFIKRVIFKKIILPLMPVIIVLTATCSIATGNITCGIISEQDFSNFIVEGLQNGGNRIINRFFDFDEIFQNQSNIMES